MTTHTTPRAMGSVKVEEVTGFSHSFTPQELVDVDDDDVVSARGSTTLLGTTIFMIASMVPIASGSAIGVGTRWPSLTIFAACRCSMLCTINLS
jgi:hypothetical protein